MTMSDYLFDEVVGLRTASGQPLSWHHASDLTAAVGDLVVATLNGSEIIAEVVIGRGQCLSYPGDPGELPRLLRPAGPRDQPIDLPTAGRRLLESLD